MGYVDSNLNPGESVVYRTSLHWIIYLMPVILVGFGATLAFGQPWPGLTLLAAGLMLVLASWIRQISSEFAVTTSRVIVKTGWLSRRTIEINLSRVESIQVDQGLLGRMLNYGTILVIGTGGTKEPFTLIADPLAFRHAVQAQQG
jgi:uncharacterized membrane protein YdbT with pleckstrin-like domain